MSALHPLAQDYLARLREAMDDSLAFGRLSAWLPRHTRLAGQPFSFKDHEYQIDIADSRHPNVAIRKPSQVGITELMVRIVLGLLATSPDVKAMVTMPTVREALRLAKSRIDPIIKVSPSLSRALVAGSDSSSFKQIGTSQLFMAGSYGGAIISIPIDIMVSDEIDFSNPETLATAESRLTHSRFHDQVLDLRGIRRKLSTPTASGIGISQLFDESDQRYRLVRCRKCGHEFWPNYLLHVVVQGFDKPFDELTYQDILQLDARGLVDTARLLCERCHETITRENLGPEYRSWVAMKPENKRVEGWAVTPFDLPAYHTPVSIMRKQAEYRAEVGHFRNFTLGLPHDDASNSILDSVVEANTVLKPLPPDVAAATGTYGCILGLDLGKTSWLWVARRVLNQVHILWLEPIRLRDDRGGGLKDVVIERMRQYGAVLLNSDALPYTDAVLEIQAAFPEGMVHPCMYTLHDNKLPAYRLVEKDQSIEANRTRTLNRVAQRINSGEVLFPIMPEMAVARQHFQGMKRVDRFNDSGELVQSWVKGEGKDDHYFHAMNYLLMADDLIAVDFMGWAPEPSIHRVEVGVKHVQKEGHKEASPLTSVNMA